VTRPPRGNVVARALAATMQKKAHRHRKDSGNPYPAGRLILLGVPQPDQDATFRTYGSTSTSVGGFVQSTNNLPVLVPYLAVIGLVATAAIALKRRRN
jgi:hypothetical protein